MLRNEHDYAVSNSSDHTKNFSLVNSSTTISDLLVEYNEPDDTNIKGTHTSKNSSKKGNYDTYQMKMYGNEKETLEHLAGLAGTDMTAFAKKRIFSDDKIIILDSGRYISRSLIEISDCLKAAQRENKISDDIYDRTYKKLCEILSEFISLSKELTLFKEANQQEENI